MHQAPETEGDKLSRQHTFTHNDLTITVHTRTGGDELDAEVVYSQMIGNDAAPTALWYRGSTFARIITQTDSVTGALGFTLPDALALPSERKAAYDALMERTDGLVKRWRVELDAVDAPPGEPVVPGPKESAPDAPLTTGSDASITAAKPKKS